MSVVGHLDWLTSSGYVEGWAYDLRAPLEPLPVSVIDTYDREIAWGLAHHFRGDLADAEHAAGWCAFRVKLKTRPAQFRSQILTLADRRSHSRIMRRGPMPYKVDAELKLSNIAALIAADPSLIGSFDELCGCTQMFETFIAKHGAEQFVRAAYGYVNSRPADAEGLVGYLGFLKSQEGSPLDLLRRMADSDEYRSRPRQHCAPTRPGFPFRFV